MKEKLFLICFVVPFIFFACSSSQQSTDTAKENVPEKKAKDSLYVFDAVTKSDNLNSTQNSQPEKRPDNVSSNPQRMEMTYYVVQIGAFTSKEKADEFAASSRTKINYQINVNYNPDVKLFVVQLLPEYTSHSDAEKVRDEIWQLKEFKDAWISTVQK